MKAREECACFLVGETNPREVPRPGSNELVEFLAGGRDLGRCIAARFEGELKVVLFDLGARRARDRRIERR